METITIKIEGAENASFFIKLLRKFNFIKEIEVIENSSSHKIMVAEAPVDWAEKAPSIDDFAGIWKDHKISLNEIRSNGWKRN